MFKFKKAWLVLVFVLSISLSACGTSLQAPGDTVEEPNTEKTVPQNSDLETDSSSFDLTSIPEFSGTPYVVVNGNDPYFTDTDLTTTDFETYDDLDDLGRCTTAYACIGQELMPTEDRESISSVTPTGWINREYDGEYLYNRCHLIGFQLTGENANEENLITGTRYMNVEGMLPFENMVADYIDETSNHALYRVTPVFEDENLDATGVLMEGYSVEDDGDGICFNVFCYNVQPGIEIDYETGGSWKTGTAEQPAAEESGEEVEYILNTRSRKFHLPECSGAASMSESNKEYFHGTREEVLAEGYDPCGICNP